ncbi:MAG: hypothetical protein KGJ66_02815, partial [Alphaproteobacteria bacterium]|nr:hypothetical protein [Alphaproteobacteria bacterium]
SACRNTNAICASENFDAFIVLPRPTALKTHTAKLEFSSKDRSKNREAGHPAPAPTWLSQPNPL